MDRKPKGFSRAEQWPHEMWGEYLDRLKRERYPLWVRLLFAVFVGWIFWGVWLAIPVFLLSMILGRPTLEPLPLWVWVVCSFAAFVWASRKRGIGPTTIDQPSAQPRPDVPETPPAE